jgi:hypothetical protein
MRVRTRKLIWHRDTARLSRPPALAVASIASGRITTALPYAADLLPCWGLAWVLPAGLLIRWMQRPDG